VRTTRASRSSKKRAHKDDNSDEDPLPKKRKAKIEGRLWQWANLMLNERSWQGRNSPPRAIQSSILDDLPWKYSHSLHNENAEGITTLNWPDAIKIALLGKYRLFSAEWLAW
jgi:hypothetical protein